MKVVIAGAGSVGRSVALELKDKGHDIVLIDRSKAAIRRDLVPGATWVLADAVELDHLGDAGMEEADVVVSATGDDKVNLVLSLLAKTEFGVPRTVGRVNNPRNEWLFDSNWGVDVAVSTPRLMTALVEEAVEVGGLVNLMHLEKGRATLMEFTVHEGADVLGRRTGTIEWPPDTVLVAIVRHGKAFAPDPDDLIESGDELFFISSTERRDGLLALLRS
ncbi:potassium channel family protein [Brevibacterium litoralis]|uniref:potassium channel family protein n=1 Tax=Brevibacterium litoralis TaxID=3138935 RepID=UPI0032EDF776